MDQTLATFLIDLVKSGSFDSYELFLIIGVLAYFLRGTNLASLLTKSKQDDAPDDSVKALKDEMKTKNAAIEQELESLHNEHASMMSLLKDIRRFLFRDI